MRDYTFLDHCIRTFDSFLRKKNTFLNTKIKNTDVFTTDPCASVEREMTDSDRKKSIQLMRVNHSGEVCAQALYLGQAFVAKDPALKAHLKQSAKEETQHLSWCRFRIQELGGRTSFLNPVWWIGSLGLGMLAGSRDDKVSLGFLAETEFQVTAHLNKHLKLLPENDNKSRAILQTMRDEELEHATKAMDKGGQALPWVVRLGMKMTAKVMTITARYI